MKYLGLDKCGTTIRLASSLFHQLSVVSKGREVAIERGERLILDLLKTENIRSEAGQVLSERGNSVSWVKNVGRRERIPGRADVRGSEDVVRGNSEGHTSLTVGDLAPGV